MYDNQTQDGAIKICTLFDVPVYVHWTSFIMLFIIASLGPIVGPAAMLCLFAHEFGHILVARRYGLKTHACVVYGLGMGALIDGVRNDMRGVVIAAAGPVVNLVIALPCAVAYVFMSIHHVADEATLDPLLTMFSINVALAVFNLLPIYPLDGGRIFAGFSEKFLGARRGQNVTMYASLATAVVFTAFFVYKGMYMGAVILCIFGLPHFMRMRSMRR